MSLARSFLSFFKQPRKPLALETQLNLSPDNIRESTQCNSVCSSKIISDKGCEVVGPIKNGQASVKCLDTNTNTDRVSNSQPRDVCINNYQFPKFIPCFKVQNRRFLKAVLWTLFFSLTIVISDTYQLIMSVKGEPKKIKSLIAKPIIDKTFGGRLKEKLKDDKEIASDVMERFLEYIDEYIANELLTESQAQFLVNRTSVVLQKVLDGESSVENFFKYFFKNFVKSYNNLLSEVPEDQRSLFADYQLLTLEFALNNFPVQFLPEAIKGGHIIFKDKGQLHKKFVQETDAFKRISSHYPGNPKELQDQYGQTTQFLGKQYHLLSGLDKDGNSWFQFEGAPFKKPANIQDVLHAIDHGIDYLAYAVVGGKKYNLGPEGASKYTEYKPFIVDEPLAFQPQLNAQQFLNTSSLLR